MQPQDAHFPTPFSDEFLFGCTAVAAEVATCKSSPSTDGDVATGGDTGTVPEPSQASSPLVGGMFVVRSYLRRLLPGGGRSDAVRTLNHALNIDRSWTCLRLQSLVVILGFLQALGGILPPYFLPWRQGLYRDYVVHAEMARARAEPVPWDRIRAGVAAMRYKDNFLDTWRRRMEWSMNQRLAVGRRMKAAPVRSDPDTPRCAFRACLYAMVPGTLGGRRYGRLARMRINALVQNKMEWNRLPIPKLVTILRLLQTLGHVPDVFPPFSNSSVDTCYRACVEHVSDLRSVDVDMVAKQVEGIMRSAAATARWRHDFHSGA